MIKKKYIGNKITVGRYTVTITEDMDEQVLKNLELNYIIVEPKPKKVKEDKAEDSAE